MNRHDALIAMLLVESDWEKVGKMSWEEVQAIETEHGPVGSFQMKNGHYLVLKVETSQMTDGSRGAAVRGDGKEGESIVLPKVTSSKTVGNLHSIRGIVLRASAPYVEKRARKLFRWNAERCGRESYWEPFNIASTEAAVREGEGIVYNSFNMGQIRAEGLNERLCIVREMDIEVAFPREVMDEVDVTEFVFGLTDAA